MRMVEYHCPQKDVSGTGHQIRMVSGHHNSMGPGGLYLDRDGNLGDTIEEAAASVHYAYVGAYSDETDEYEEENCFVDHSVEELLVKSEALAFGENTMVKRRKVKRADQAAVVKQKQLQTLTSDQNIPEEPQGCSVQQTGKVSSFVSVKITTDAHIQEMGRLFKEGFLCVASLSNDCNVIRIKKVSQKPLKQSEVIASPDRVLSTADKTPAIYDCRNIFTAFDNSACDIRNKDIGSNLATTKVKHTKKTKRKLKDKTKEFSSKLGKIKNKTKHSHVLQPRKQKSHNIKATGKDIIAGNKSFDIEIHDTSTLTDFEKALCTPDSGVKTIKVRPRSVAKKSKKIISKNPSVSSTIESKPVQPEVYIDVADNPESDLSPQYLTSIPYPQDKDNLTEFKTIEDFEFLKDTTNNNKQEQNRNGDTSCEIHQPNGYLSFKVDTDNLKVCSYDLDHYGTDLFRVPVKDELVGTPLGKKRKLPHTYSTIKSKVTKKIDVEEQRSGQSKEAPKVCDKSCSSSEKASPSPEPEPATVEQNSTHKVDATEDDWDLEEYELKEPAVEVIACSINTTTSPINDSTEPVVIDCDQYTEPGKMFSKQLKLKKDSANVSIPRKETNRSVAEVLSVISLAKDSYNNSDMYNLERMNVTQNNNSTSQSKEQPPCSVPLGNTRKNVTTEQFTPSQAASFQEAFVKSAGLQTCIASASHKELQPKHVAIHPNENIPNSIGNSQSNAFLTNHISAQSTGTKAIFSSANIKTCENAHNIVKNVLNAGIISSTLYKDVGQSRSERTVLRENIKVPDSSTKPVSLMTDPLEAMPPPLLTLAEIASNELSPPTLISQIDDDVRRQALAKILPSPIVSPVAKPATEKEQKHTPSSSPIIEALKKPSQLRFSLNENGEVNHEGTSDLNPSCTVAKGPLYFSSEGVSEKKRKRKYAFASNFIDELSSEQTQFESAAKANKISKVGEGAESVTDVQKSNFQKGLLDHHMQSVSSTEHTVKQSLNEQPAHTKTQTFFEHPSLNQTVVQSPHVAPYQFVPNSRSLVTPENQRLLHHIEEMKSNEKFPFRDVRPIRHPQTYLNSLPPFNTFNTRNVHPMHFVQRAQHLAIPTYAGPNDQFQFPMVCHPCLVPPSNASDSVKATSVVHSTQSTNTVQSGTDIYCSSGGSVMANNLSHSTEPATATSVLTNSSNQIGLLPQKAASISSPVGTVGPVGHAKVLPKVSPQNLKLYQKQLADKHSSVSNEFGEPRNADIISNPINPDSDVSNIFDNSQTSFKTPHYERTLPHKPIYKGARQTRGKIRDIRNRNRNTKIGISENKSADASCSPVEINSGLDLLSAAAHLPDTVPADPILNKMDHTCNQSYDYLDTPNKVTVELPPPPPALETITHDSFLLPQTPPESLNDHDDHLDSVKSTEVEATQHGQALSSFSKSELFEELLKRQSLTKCRCGCSFLDSTMYMLHRASHNTDKPHMCAYCGKVGRSWMDFYAHMCDHSK